MLQALRRFRRHPYVFALALIFLGTLSPHAALSVSPDPVRFGVTIEAGDHAAAERWLKAGLDPNYEADRIGTGLMIAAWEGDIRMMEVFLRYGANINHVNERGEQALLHAAWKGHLPAVEWLLARGAQLNRGKAAWSALHYAVFAGHEEVAHVLVERGADIDARSPNGSSVLMMAAREGRESLARWLVERGADTTVTNEYGDDALDWALRRGHVRLAQQLAAPPARFAEAAREATAAPPPVASIEAPADLSELVRELRQARAAGRSTDEVLRRYASAIDAHLSAPPKSASAPGPRALEITGRRHAPGEERARLLYERDQRSPSPPMQR